MPRGKNYVNNNRGVSLQKSGKKKTKGGATTSSMQECQYGAGCTRPDCIYRHDGPNSEKKRDDVCLPFLAGKCTFKAGGCRKRHPKDKAERERLLAKYKRTRCRFGDECHTEGCLYLHPAEQDEKDKEPNYIEPDHVAFPPLNGGEKPHKQAPLPSAWRPALVPSPAPTSVPAGAGAGAPALVQADDKVRTSAPVPTKEQKRQTMSTKQQRKPEKDQPESAPQEELSQAPMQPNAWSSPPPIQQEPAPVAPSPDQMQYQQPPMQQTQPMGNGQQPYPMYDMHMNMPPQPYMGGPFPPPPYFDPSMSHYGSPHSGMMSGYGGMDYAVGYTIPFTGSPQSYAGGFNANAKEFVPGGH